MGIWFWEVLSQLIYVKYFKKGLALKNVFIDRGWWEKVIIATWQSYLSILFRLSNLIYIYL